MIIDGNAIAKGIRARLKADADTAPRLLGMAAVVIGDDPGIKKFVDVKKKAAEEIGIQFSVYAFAADEESKALETLAWLAEDTDVHGIFVELPLPAGCDTEKMLNAIPLSKDIDVLSDAAQAAHYGDHSSIAPPAVGALKMLFNYEHIEVAGKKAAIFGQGMLVGKPITHWLKECGAEVFMIDEHTEDPSRFSLLADIIISGVGKPGLITGDMIREGAVVVDYGYSPSGAGDVETETIAPKAAFLTPVPGGMGPLVVAAVLENLVMLSKEN